MNFYQSSLWHTISQEIYRKPIFTFSFHTHSYRGITKHQNRLGQDLKRYMSHGMRLDDHHALVDHADVSVEVARSLEQIRRDFRKGWGDIFFQFGFVDEIDECQTVHLKDQEVVEAFITQKKQLRDQLFKNYKLVPSRRRHMPDATIMLDLRKSADEAWSGYSDSGKRYINKAKKSDLSFTIATQKDREIFYQVRYKTAYDKGFYVLPKEHFLDLMKRLTDTGNGRLFLATKDDKPVSGSVCVKYEHDLVYLYGATDRSYGDIGGHYWLTHQIHQRGHDNGYHHFDLLGVAPPDAAGDHPLSGVTRFKQAFGGKTVMYLGNYDLVFNPRLYQAFLRMRK